MLEIRNFDLTSIVLKLVKFPLFDNLFFDLANFQDLNVFLLFDFLDLNNFPDFLICFISFLPISNLSILLLLLFLLKTGLLLLFLLKTNLLPLFLLGASLLGNPVIFSIEMNGVVISLKP